MQRTRQIGFDEIIYYALNSGKPFVGHNCVADFMHISKYFLSNDNTLPPTLKGFSDQLLNNNIQVYDTKMMFQSDPKFAKECQRGGGSASRLANALSALGGEPSGEHDAGGDSLMTAQIFIKLLQRNGAISPSKAGFSADKLVYAKNVFQFNINTYQLGEEI